MIVIERGNIPYYEVICPECKSKILYKASETSNLHITCPVCGISVWAECIFPINDNETIIKEN